MNNVRNLFQILCILAMLVALTNCQQENNELLVAAETSQEKFPYTTSVLNTLDVATNTKLSTTMRNITTLQSQHTAESGGAYDFTIYTDVVKLIESTESNAHSYTFPIERVNTTGSELENIVFSYEEATDSYQAHLVTYHFNAAQKQEFLQMQVVSSAYQVTHETIALNLADIMGENVVPIPCNTIYTTYHITPDTGETFLYSTNGVIQNTCEHEHDLDPCETYTVIEMDCPDSGNLNGDGNGTDDNTTSGPYSSPNNTPSGGGTSSDGGTSTTNDGTNDSTNDIVTSPITREEYNEITQIMNDVVGEGNWRFDDTVSEDAPNFNTREELEAYLESLVSDNITTESTEFLDLQQSTRRDRHTMQFSSFPSATLKATVKLQVPNPNTPLSPSDILNVRTRVHGSTTLYEWTQLDDEDISNSSSSPQITVYQAQNRLKIEVEGNMEMGIRFFGSWLTTDHSIIVELVYDLTTGELIPQYSRWYYDI